VTGWVEVAQAADWAEVRVGAGLLAAAWAEAIVVEALAVALAAALVGVLEEGNVVAAWVEGTLAVVMVCKDRALSTFYMINLKLYELYLDLNLYTDKHILVL
jgi:hypothetical protein